jgi:ABC-2 type transport system permease protein
MAALILISLAIIPSFTTSGSGSNSANTQILTYYDSGGTYHFISFAWNQFGQAVAGVTFQANLTVFSGSSSQAVYRGSPDTTNSSGMADFTIIAPLNDNYTPFFSITQPNGYVSACCGIFQPYLTYVSSNGTKIPAPASIGPGQVVNAMGSSPELFSSVTDSSNSSQNDIQVIWAGLNGSVPLNYALYYKFLNTTTVCQSSQSGQVCFQTVPGTSGLNESNMRVLGTMSSFKQIFTPPKLESNLSTNAVIALALFYPNGTSVSPVSAYPLDVFYPGQNQFSIQQGTSFAVSFFEGIFGFLIPLIAIVGSYNSYGKDRVSGVLDSILSQPVSRRGLSLSRYLSSFVAMAIAVSIAIAVVDGIVRYFTGSFLASTLVFSSAGAFFVELATFTGIMMLLSHLTKSSGLLIGIGIGLFIVIDFFWGTIMSLVAVLANVQYGTIGFFQIAVLSQFANPAEFVSLIVTYLTHQASFVGISGFTFPITPSQYGITVPAIVATGVLWVAVPLAVFLYLAIKRD